MKTRDEFLWDLCVELYSFAYLAVDLYDLDDVADKLYALRKEFITLINFDKLAPELKARYLEESANE